MEVHHSHHPAHKKDWKEYGLEFFMLFFAVTLGFFAENLREHKIINERLEQTKIAILKDLKQDAVTMDSILVQEEYMIQHYNRALNTLYLYKSGKINESQLHDTLRVMKSLVAGTSTLYVNNSSFKNMQSSGLLSNLEDNELKANLSYYYEVIFKRIESNNNFFDQAGINYNNAFPMGLGTYVRDYSKQNNDYKLNNTQNYFEFMLSIRKTRDILKSDEFIYDMQKFYNYIFVYRLAITKAQEENKKLIKLMEADK